MFAGESRRAVEGFPGGLLGPRLLCYNRAFRRLPGRARAHFIHSSISALEDEALNRPSLVALMLLSISTPAVLAGPAPGLQWVWFAEADGVDQPPSEPRFFRRSFEVEGAVDEAVLHITCDNRYRVWLNERQVGGGTTWEAVDVIDVSRHARPGRNVLAVEARNDSGPAGLVAQLVVREESGRKTVVLSDGVWRASAERSEGWRRPEFDDSAWPAARVIKPFGSPGLWDASRWIEPGAPPPYDAPEGFSVSEVASHQQIGSAVAFTFDGRGRPIVSRERGPIQVVVGADRDGVCDEVQVLSDRVTNCQGLCVIGESLYAVGDGPDGTGLYRLEDSDGDDAADEVTLITRFRGGMGEHGPHAVCYGPDGFLYLVVGNHAFLGSPVADDSPHRAYGEDQLVPTLLDAGGHARGVRAPGGTVFRHRPGSDAFRLFCGGFRNQYDVDFDARGEVFTFDSDMEWDVNLPWYRPVRVNHCVPGGEYGWRTGSGKWPEHYYDSLPSTHDVGRGSPTGVAFYRHRQFPGKYRGAFFASDWSMGRILAIFTEPRGATYAAGEETFVTGKPLNVTDVEVGPEGALYFTTGGRGTRGGLYRVLHDGSGVNRSTDPATLGDLLRQPQPQAAWARGGADRLRARLGASWDAELRRVSFETSSEPDVRLRAIDLREQHGPAVEAAEAVALSRDEDPEVRARAAWILGDRPGEETRARLVELLRDDDALVARRACEGLVRQGLDRDDDAGDALVAGVIALLDDADRWVRFAARSALERLSVPAWRYRVLSSASPRVVSHGLLAWIHCGPAEGDWEAIRERAVSLLESVDGVEERLEALRLIQVAKARGGDFSESQRRRLGARAIESFPSADWRLDRELALLLAYAQPDGARSRLLAQQRSGASRAQQIHYAYCLRLIGGEWTEEEIREMYSWFGPALQWKGGHSFHGYIEYLWSAWLEKLPAAERQRLEREKAALAEVELPIEATPNPAGRAAGARQPGSRTYDEVLDFLRTDKRARKGSPAKGALAFEKAGCARCHRFGEVGEGAGPDLTTVSSRFRTEEVLESIYYPSRVISDQYVGVEIVTRTGEVLLGMPAFEDAEKLVIVKTDGTRATIAKKDIVSREAPSISVMPAGLLDGLELGEIADLFAYLRGES